MKKEKVTIPMTTLDFYRYEKDGIIYYEFDARECVAPEPMLNTLHALRILKDEERLVGYYFHEPTPLYAKIENFFSYEAQKVDDGDYKVTFKKI
jgi:hypothetical protein